ncbi:hypothetical protein [Amycolatopsis sp. NPDC001319]|uniref:hypothetical protein n=1 Tax=unclassified Amycolatopsis TaxID=2618356 RepID=UPI0036D07ED1
MFSASAAARITYSSAARLRQLAGHAIDQIDRCALTLAAVADTTTDTAKHEGPGQGTAARRGNSPYPTPSAASLLLSCADMPRKSAREPRE